MQQGTSVWASQWFTSCTFSTFLNTVLKILPLQASPAVQNLIIRVIFNRHWLIPLNYSCSGLSRAVWKTVIISGIFLSHDSWAINKEHHPLRLSGKPDGSGAQDIQCVWNITRLLLTLSTLPVISLCTYKRDIYRETWMTGIEAITDLNDPGCTAVSLCKQVGLAKEIWFITFTHTYRFLTFHPWVLEPLVYPGGRQIPMYVYI